LVWDGARVFVAGPDTRAVPVSSTRTFVGIRFRPGSAPGFLGVAAHELLDARVPLRELWGNAADDLAERLHTQPAAATSLFEEALLRRVRDLGPADPLVGEVLGALGRNPASVSILSTRLGV